jgi:nitroreductase
MKVPTIKNLKEDVMDVITAIHTRRSVRAYTDAPVGEETVQIMLAAAMTAPSAGNGQPWEFVVVDDPTLLAGIPEIHPYAHMAPKAPLGILVCGNTAKEKYPGFWVQDCSAATENLLLAAVGCGLGAVWLGVYPVQERVAAFADRFGLPEEVIPLAFVVIGHPRQEQQTQNRYDASKIHRNSRQKH